MAFLCFLLYNISVGGKVYTLYHEYRLKKRGECQTKNKDFRVWCWICGLKPTNNLQHVHQRMGQLVGGTKRLTSFFIRTSSEDQKKNACVIYLHFPFRIASCLMARTKFS